MNNDLYPTDAADTQNVDFKDVDITDRYMFAYVMQNREICMELLQYIFPEHTIQKIDYLTLDERKYDSEPQIEKTITPSFGKHGVRLDVYVDGGAQIYNVEMQTTSQIALNKRALYYSSVINVDQLPRGGAYDQLRPSYVIFICKFDPFGKNQYLYSFRYVCSEVPLNLEDGSHIFFLNTKGTDGNIANGMKEILRYMNDAKDFPVDKTDYELIKKIDRAVIEARADDDWRREYMTYLVHQRAAKLEGIAIGEQRGIAIGEQRGREEGKILGAIEVLRQTGMNDSAIKSAVAKSFNLSVSDVDKYMATSAQ